MIKEDAMYSDNLKTIAEQKRDCLSKPQRGMSFETATEIRAVHIRRAVSLLADGFDQSRLFESYNAVFAPRWEISPGINAYEQDIRTRAAWNLICVWLLARSHNGISSKAGFPDGEEWFVDNSQICVPPLFSLIASENLEQAKYEVSKVSLDQDFWDLFPYILQELRSW